MIFLVEKSTDTLETFTTMSFQEATAVHTCGPGERAILAIWLARAVSIASAVA
jgi:hypothetical protein